MGGHATTLRPLESAGRPVEESSRFRHEGVSHSCGFRGYAHSGWWPGVAPRSTERRSSRLRAMAEVEFTRDDAALTITLNRPDVLNAINLAVHKGIAAALEQARDPEVRAVVITGAGRGFCVGQDLNEFREHAGST